MVRAEVKKRRRNTMRSGMEDNGRQVGVVRENATCPNGVNGSDAERHHIIPGLTQHWYFGGDCVSPMQQVE